MHEKIVNKLFNKFIKNKGLQDCCSWRYYALNFDNNTVCIWYWEYSELSLYGPSKREFKSVVLPIVF